MVPRWYPPSPMHDTSRPVRPSGRLGTLALGCAIARPPVPKAVVWRKLRREKRFAIFILLLLLRAVLRIGLAGVLRRTQHLLHFLLLHVERKLMDQPRFRIVELKRNLVGFKARVGGEQAQAVAQRL